MDKVKKILEGYVEWIALGLGACFLLWMVYSYAYLPPVTVPVGPSPAVLPGQIDTQIWESQGRMLKSQIDARVPPVKVAVPAFSEAVATAIGRTPPETKMLLDPYTVAANPPDGPAIAIAPVDDKETPGAKVTAPPVAPKPINLAVSNGHSNTLAVADPATGTAAAVGPGNGLGNVPANGIVPVANQATDKGWVTVAVTIPSASQMDAAFTQANIPAAVQLRQTTMLRVDLLRQEMDATGTWGPEKLIPPPPIDALQPMPPPVATDANSARTQQSYLDFARKDAGLIIRPAFYQIIQGDKWFVPGSPNPNVKADELVEEKFDPSKYLTGSLDGLDKEQQDAVRKLRRETAATAAKAKQAADAQARRDRQAQMRGSRGSRTTPPPGGNGPGGGGASPGTPPGFLVADPERAANALALADGPSIFNPAAFPPPGTDPAPPGGTAPVDPASATGGDAPATSFDPHTQKDFVAWAHDDTVRPGKTYRYRIRYSISNPVYGTLQLCKPQSIAAHFTITSEPSDWSAPVNVESDSNFYASAVGPRGAVTFDVFKWQSGVWTMKTVNVEPGDTIAGADWTVVDVRPIPNEPPTNCQVILASDNGILERDIKTDKKNKTYHDLLAHVHAAMSGQQPGATPGSPEMPTSDLPDPTRPR